MKTCQENALLTNASLLLYRIDMAHGGRPIERPAHLSPEQRVVAQQHTRQWREDAGLSQREMAARIAVSYSTYRGWESGKDQYAGPTREQTEHLNRALRELLGSRYADGDAFTVWGWPRQQDITYDQVVELLRSAGFEVPRLHAGAHTPTGVFWVHKVHRPNLLHGVFAMAAAALTRAGVLVHLLLDDGALPDRERDWCAELEASVRTWVAFASGDDAKLSIGLFSSVLADGILADRGWQAIGAYLNSHSTVLDILLASKVISPIQFSLQEEQSVLEVMRNDGLKADRLLTALRNWLVFEAEITRILRSAAVATSSVLTLGGDDERILWEVWRRGCSDELASRVEHIFLKPMPMPPYDSAWDRDALTPRTDRTGLTNYVNQRLASDPESDLVEWLLRSAIRLPAALNPGFRARLDPALTDVAALLELPARELAPYAGAVCRAVVEWLRIPRVVN
jgi:transcriptional regulator with XRE-family HTH domain